MKALDLDDTVDKFDRIVMWHHVYRTLLEREMMYLYKDAAAMRDRFEDAVNPLRWYIGNE